MLKCYTVKNKWRDSMSESVPMVADFDGIVGPHAAEMTARADQVSAEYQEAALGGVLGIEIVNPLEVTATTPQPTPPPTPPAPDPGRPPRLKCSYGG